VSDIDRKPLPVDYVNGTSDAGRRRAQARLVLQRSSADFSTTPGLVFFYSYMGADCSDGTCCLQEQYRHAGAQALAIHNFTKSVANPADVDYNLYFSPAGATGTVLTCYGTMPPFFVYLCPDSEGG
jgi:hypothetical protein